MKALGRPAVAAFAMVLGSVALLSLFGSAAANLVEPTHLGEVAAPLSAEDLKPPECAGLVLTSVTPPEGPGGGAQLVLVGNESTRYRSTGGGDCVVGGAGDDELSGGGGSDVIIGGPGNDTLSGGGGTDALFGGPGDDFLDGGGGTDFCDGGDGSDAATRCETEAAIP